MFWIKCLLFVAALYALTIGFPHYAMMSADGDVIVALQRFMGASIFGACGAGYILYQRYIDLLKRLDSQQGQIDHALELIGKLQGQH